MIEGAQPDVEARQFSPVQRRPTLLPPVQPPGPVDQRALATRRQAALLKCELRGREPSPAKKRGEEVVVPEAFSLAEEAQSPPVEERHPRQGRRDHSPEATPQARPFCPHAEAQRHQVPDG